MVKLYYMEVAGKENNYEAATKALKGIIAEIPKAQELVKNFLGLKDAPTVQYEQDLSKLCDFGSKAQANIPSKEWRSQITQGNDLVSSQYYEKNVILSPVKPDLDVIDSEEIISSGDSERSMCSLFTLFTFFSLYFLGRKIEEDPAFLKQDASPKEKDNMKVDVIHHKKDPSLPSLDSLPTARKKNDFLQKCLNNSMYYKPIFVKASGIHGTDSTDPFTPKFTDSFKDKSKAAPKKKLPFPDQLFPSSQTESESYQCHIF